MLLSLDSLGQCVSALSKRFVAAESARDSSVGCPPHCQRDKHPEVRHRKDGLHQQDDAPRLKVTASTPPLQAIGCSPPAASDQVLSLALR